MPLRSNQNLFIISVQNYLKNELIGSNIINKRLRSYCSNINTFIFSDYTKDNLIEKHNDEDGTNVQENFEDWKKRILKNAYAALDRT